MLYIGDGFASTGFRRVSAVNVDGVFLGIKHAFRAMRPGGAAGNGAG